MHSSPDAQALLDGLNPAQREAVTHPGGPLLVFAGAGSGKTRVLTHRIAYLIAERGVSPYHILAVTFTNKAANEMRERTERLIHRSCRGLWIGTFHACCARMLRESGPEIGIPGDFVIYDDADQITVVRDTMRALNIDAERYQPRGILTQISKAKERLIDAAEYARTAQAYYERLCARVYEKYEEHLRLNNALDFDDLLMHAVTMLRQHETVLQRYQNRFQHILVDEYQDINYAQYVLVNLLGGKHRNVCVVGDDDQSIYAFRGADVDLMLRFEHDYPDAHVIKLEQNYRSTRAILQAAHNVVSNNRTRKSKRLWTDNDPGRPIELYELPNEQEEAIFVTQRIQHEVLRGDRRYGDFAVLYRTNAQSRAFEEVFTNFRVPHRLVGARPFYQRKEVKDILAYLRVARNPQDTVSLKRVINVPARGIGATSLAHLERQADEAGATLWDVIAAPHNVKALTARARKTLAEFAELIRDLHDLAARLSVSDLTREVIDRTGYIADLAARSTLEDRDRIENVQELLTVVQRFDESEEDDRSLARFLEQVALVSDLDDQDLSQNAVTLMTLHASKGLEFGIVFLVGMEEGLFPHVRALESERDTEEERRLCYVGITRARQELIVTHVYRRSQFGVVTNNKPSRFISEMGLLPSPRASTGSPASAPRLEPQTAWQAQSPVGLPTTSAVAPFKPGDRVRHDSFGQGVVVSMKPSGNDWEVAVAFPANGVKRLLVSLAKLKPVTSRASPSSVDHRRREQGT